MDGVGAYGVGDNSEYLARPIQAPIGQESQGFMASTIAEGSARLEPS